MSTNLEIKIKLNSFDELEKDLEKINADFIKVLNQKDIYYKFDKGLLKLRIQNDEAELIRYLRDDSGKDRFSDFEYLYLPKENSEDFFDKIFTTEAVVEKKRRLFMYDNTRIHLDEVKKLGKFLELETLVIKDKQDAIKRFNFLINKLQIDFKNQIRNSYRDLILNKA